MLPNSGYNTRFLRPLVNILRTLEVRDVILFIGGLREGDRNVFTGNPLIEVVFNLDSEIRNPLLAMKRKKNIKTYNYQGNCDGRQREHFILKKLRVHHA